MKQERTRRADHRRRLKAGAIDGYEVVELDLEVIELPAIADNWIERTETPDRRQYETRTGE